MKGDSDIKIYIALELAFSMSLCPWQSFSEACLFHNYRNYLNEDEILRFSRTNCLFCCKPPELLSFKIIHFLTLTPPGFQKVESSASGPIKNSITFEDGPQSVKILKLRSQILGSFEITKTNEVNMHGFCTDSFFKWLIKLNLGLRVY